MSDEKIIDDLILEFTNEGIEPRKKSPVISLAVTVAGAVVLGLAFIEPVSENANLSSGLMLCGVLLLITGIIMLASALGGKGKPFYKPSGEFLKRNELRFDLSHKDKARQMLTEGDFEALADLPAGEASAVKAVIYKTSDNEFAVAQLLEYVPHYYRGASEIKVFRKGEFIRSGKMS